jgi:hypothetical protein
MKRIDTRTSMARCALVNTALAIVIGSGSLVVAQSARTWAVDQAQRAVREQMTSDDGDIALRFNNDARTDSSSNNRSRVRGSGTAVRDCDGKSRPFVYDAVVNARTSNVSDVHHDWRGDWRTAVTNRLTGTYRLNRERSDGPEATADRATRSLPKGEQPRLRAAISRRHEAPGAVIGAVADGGKGAAIGAAVGGGAAVGSVFVQGRDDFELANGTEFRIRARGRE